MSKSALSGDTVAQPAPSRGTRHRPTPLDVRKPILAPDGGVADEDFGTGAQPLNWPCSTIPRRSSGRECRPLGGGVFANVGPSGDYAHSTSPCELSGIERDFASLSCQCPVRER